MSPSLLLIVSLALSSAFLSGLLFVFSNFAMKAFSRLPGGAGVAAMQAVNAQILNPVFFTIFGGTALAALAALAGAAFQWSHPASVWIIAGSVLLLGGLYLVTARINVPLNEKLDTVNPSSPEAAEAWMNYVRRWQPWNHLRTVACILAATCFAIGAVQMGFV